MLRARNASKRNGTKDKVVKRELCSILSRGTRTYCFLDDISSTPDGSPRSVNMILSIKVNHSLFFCVLEQRMCHHQTKAFQERIGGMCLYDEATLGLPATRRSMEEEDSV